MAPSSFAFAEYLKDAIDAHNRTFDGERGCIQDSPDIDDLPAGPCPSAPPLESKEPTMSPPVRAAVEPHGRMFNGENCHGTPAGPSARPAHPKRQREPDACGGGLSHRQQLHGPDHRPNGDKPPSEPPYEQSRRNIKRRIDRRKKIDTHCHRASPNLLREHVQLAEGITPDLKLTSLPAAAGAYSAKRLMVGREERQREYTEGELIRDHGFVLVQANANETVTISDVNGVIYGLVAPGMPHKPSYQAALRGAFRLISTWGEVAEFSPSEKCHHRGNYPAVAYGISLGPGCQVPMRRNVGHHSAMVGAFLQSPDLKDISGYMDSVFATWAPKMHAKYQDCLRTVEGAANVSRNYAGSVFASTTVNFGPSVRTFIHRDMMNLAAGWCGITPLGTFDHRRGGKLILWEAKLIVEVASGATAFIPSATLTHSNTAVAEGEKRASFTQYSGGSLFRWADNGCKTDIQLKSGKASEYKHILAQREGQFERDLDCFTTVKKLVADI